jgi:hypothetical protein
MSTLTGEHGADLGQFASFGDGRSEDRLAESLALIS